MAQYSGKKWQACLGFQAAPGFTLVELLVGIGICSILLALATLNFHAMNDKYRIESQVKQMQADFNNVRMSAMTSKNSYGILLNPNSYTFYSYSSGETPNTTKLPLATTQVHYPIQQFSGGSSYSAFSGTLLSIDPRGCMTSPAAPLYIAVAPGVTGPAVNVLALQTAKTNVGIIQGGSCVLQ